MTTKSTPLPPEGPEFKLWASKTHLRTKISLTHDEVFKALTLIKPHGGVISRGATSPQRLIVQFNVYAQDAKHAETIRDKVLHDAFGESGYSIIAAMVLLAERN